MYFFMMKEQDLYNTLHYVTVTVRIRNSVRTWERTMQIQTVMCLLLPGNSRSISDLLIDTSFKQFGACMPDMWPATANEWFLKIGLISIVYFRRGRIKEWISCLLSHSLAVAGHRAGIEAPNFQTRGQSICQSLMGCQLVITNIPSFALFCLQQKLTHLTTLWKYCKHHS